VLAEKPGPGSVHAEPGMLEHGSAAVSSVPFFIHFYLPM
jgi:hypothetical protein